MCHTLKIVHNRTLADRPDLKQHVSINIRRFSLFALLKLVFFKLLLNCDSSLYVLDTNSLSTI